MTINRTSFVALGASAFAWMILALAALERAEHWRIVAFTACGAK
jgi:hypothetical protein